MNDKVKSIIMEGTLVRLIAMDDKQAPPSGTYGIINHIDDIGTIHTQWQNGSSLGIIYDLDNIEYIKTVIYNLPSNKCIEVITPLRSQTTPTDTKIQEVAIKHIKYEEILSLDETLTPSEIIKAFIQMLYTSATIITNKALVFAEAVKKYQSAQHDWDICSLNNKHNFNYERTYNEIKNMINQN